MSGKRPKCHLCGDRSEEIVYVWIQKRGEGDLVHYKCLKEMYELFKDQEDDREDTQTKGD